jgi:ABC-type glycerol-3-phosphate transport system permease component
MSQITTAPELTGQKKQPAVTGLGRRQKLTWRGPQIGTHAVILLLLLLSMLPVYLMIVISFKNPLQYQHERWLVSFPLRLSNYGAAWSIIGPYVWNTLWVAIVGFAGVLVLSIMGGYVFARMHFPFKEVLYYLILALLTVPWVISFVPSYMLYNNFHLLNTPWVLILPNIANGPVFGIFMLRSFFAGIPEEIYDSARIDGAGHWGLIWRITMPLSYPVLATLGVLNFVGTWNSFLWPLVAVSNKSLQQISVGLFLLSKEISISGDYSVWGPLFAGYTIASLPLVILFFLFGKFYVEGLMESGLKV